MKNNLRAKSLLVRFLCCWALTLGMTSTLVAQNVRNVPRARVLITRPVDSNRLFTLAGNTRAEANAQNDRGKVPDTFAMDHMLLQLQRSPEREQALKNFIDQQHDSSLAQFPPMADARLNSAKCTDLRQQDIETVSGWLRSSGFTVNTVYPSGMSIDFSGTAGQVLAAFHTEIHRLSVSGKDHIANMSDPQIPEALAPVVAGIVSLHDFRPHSMRKPRTQYTGVTDGIPVQLVVPADLATIYDLNPAFAAGYTGKGQTIAVLEDSDLYSTADWNHFPPRLRIIQLHFRIVQHNQSRATERNFQLFGSRSYTETMTKRPWTPNGPAPPPRTQPSSWLPARIRLRRLES